MDRIHTWLSGTDAASARSVALYPATFFVGLSIWNATWPSVSKCVSKKIAMGVTALAWEILNLVPCSLLETTSGSASGSSNRQSWTIN